MASTSSGVDATGADNLRARHAAPGGFPEDEPTCNDGQPSPGFDWRSGSSSESAPPPPPPNPNPPVFGPRTCRICLEVNHPTMIPSTIPSVPGLAPRPPKVVYESEEPDLGRLISPCKCKGSSRYVHEGCLRQWRMAMPSAERNYWKCPTCGYEYRLERLAYAKLIQSIPSQMVLTVLVFLIAVFVVGFIADPIINMYLEPTSVFGWVVGYSDPFESEPLHIADEGPLTWAEHFIKGMAGLGVVGCLKFMLTSPLQFWRFRISGGDSHRGRTSGRDRVNELSWLVILVGVGTTLYGIYQGVRAFSRRALMATAERVQDIGSDDATNEEGEQR